MTNEPFSSLARAALRLPIEDELRGRIGSAHTSKTGRGTSGALGARLSKALHGRKFGGGGGAAGSAPRPLASDPRQRAVVKVSFRKHAAGGGSGGGKLSAHASYLERDGAAREGEQGRFYDRTEDELEETRDRLRDWAENDKRHFRVMLAPESGARLIEEDGDLKGYTRDVMARMERDLGVQLDWMPDTPEVKEALEQRAQVLEANGFGARSPSGKFYFRVGAREELRRAELEREGDTRTRGDARDLIREGETWRVREVKELFSGKTAILERGRDVLAHPLGRGSDIKAGDEVAFKAIPGRGPSREPTKHELVKSLARGLDLGR